MADIDQVFDMSILEDNVFSVEVDLDKLVQDGNYRDYDKPETSSSSGSGLYVYGRRLSSYMSKSEPTTLGRYRLWVTEKQGQGYLFYMGPTCSRGDTLINAQSMDAMSAYMKDSERKKLLSKFL